MKMRLLAAGSLCWLLAITPARAAEGEDGLAALVTVLREADDAEFQLDILKGLSDALKGRRNVAMPAGWAEVEPKLSRSARLEIRSLTLGLGLTFGSDSALTELRKLVGEKSAPAASRLAALDSLLGARDQALPGLLQGLMDAPELRAPALRGLAAFDDARTPEVILAAYASLSPTEKKDALNTLTSRANYAKPLLAAVAAERVPARDLTAELVRQLRNLKNAELDQEIQKVWGAFRETTADKKAEIAKYVRIYRAGGSQPGDAPRGRAVFARVCLQCHTLFDAGGKVGPDLTGSNRADLAYILENMVDPNAVIPNDYRTSTIETKDERVITGIVKQQDDKAMTILTANESITLPRGEVKSVQLSEISMMPEGLLAQLAEQEIRDLIYYLSRPGQVPLPEETK